MCDTSYWFFSSSKVNAFARAYYYYYEPIYSQLICLFGMEGVKVEDVKEIVVISDNTEEILDDEIMNNQNDDTDEEVNFLAMFPGPQVRRKMFLETPRQMTANRVPSQVYTS